jgi:hypothetical protein
MTAFGKRLDGPGGRRHSARAPVLMSAAMHAVGTSQTVSLVDVSRTGAKLRGHAPLEIGKEVWLKAPPADMFGTIVWVDGDHCGVEFETPLGEEEAATLQARGKVVLMPRLSLEEQLGIEDWKNGFFVR